MLKQFLPVCLLVFLSTLLRAAPGVYIYKPNAASSSAKAGKYLSYSRVGSTTKVITGSGRTLSITKFQPSVFLPYIDPYKHGMIRVGNLAGFKKTYSKYSAAYTKYPSARPHLKSQVDSLKKVVEHREKGEGYYKGQWVSYGAIDQLIASELKAEERKQRAKALAYVPRLKLTNGRVYQKVSVTKKLYDKVLIKHEGGATSIKYDQLPTSLRIKLGEFEFEAQKKERASIAKKKEAQIEREAARKRIAEEQRVAEIQRDKEEKQKLIELYTKHANKGLPKYQYKLAMLHKESKNYKEAFKWFKKAAEAEHAESQYELAKCYASGVVGEADEQKATEWYAKAANQGHSDASKALKSLLAENTRKTNEHEKEMRKGTSDSLVNVGTFTQEQYDLFNRHIPADHCGVCGYNCQYDSRLREHLTLHILQKATRTTSADELELLLLMIRKNGVSSYYDKHPTTIQMQIMAIKICQKLHPPFFKEN